MRVPSGPKERGREGEGEGVVRNRDEKKKFFSATLAYNTLCIQLSLERSLFLFNKYIYIYVMYTSTYTFHASSTTDVPIPALPSEFALAPEPVVPVAHLSTSIAGQC